MYYAHMSSMADLRKNFAMATSLQLDFHVNWLADSSKEQVVWSKFNAIYWPTRTRYLSVGDDWKEKNPEQRALHAQNLISTELEIPALTLTCHDVNEYKKSVVKQRVKPVDIDSLVRQVIEVLPNIPESEIRADLSKYF